MPSFNSVARWIVEKGIDNINPNMLSSELKKDVLTEAGLLFYNENNIKDAVKALKLANNTEKLYDWGKEFLRQNKVVHAALCLIPAGDQKLLEEVAGLCAKEGHVEVAYEAFVAAGNQNMATFIKENFL